MLVLACWVPCYLRSHGTRSTVGTWLRRQRRPSGIRPQRVVELSSIVERLARVIHRATARAGTACTRIPTDLVGDTLAIVPPARENGQLARARSVIRLARRSARVAHSRSSAWP